MRVLVTGGAGFIGSEFVRGLLRRGCADVTVLDALTRSGNTANLAPIAGHSGFTLVHGDIRDPDLVDRVMPGHDYVVHFAAESSADRSVAGATVIATNVLGTQVLLDAAVAHGIARFVHVSTGEFYGPVRKGRWAEDQAPAPGSPYAASRSGADLLVLAHHRTHDLDVVITRCSNTYGPYQAPEKLVPLLVCDLLDGGRLRLYGDGCQVREWLHVEDHCRGIELALTRGRAGEVYHLGGGAEVSDRDLAGRVLAACGADWSAVDHVPGRGGPEGRRALNPHKSRAELGFRPRVAFEEGLAATVSWYRQNRTWWEPLRARTAVGL